MTWSVLYYAQNKAWWDIEEEIGQMEGELIRQHRPILNAQIPKAENWRKWDIVAIDEQAALSALLART